MSLKDKFDWNRKVTQKELSHILLILTVYLFGQSLCYAILGDKHIITGIWIIVGAVTLFGYVFNLCIKK